MAIKISLTRQEEAKITERIRSGRYASASEVVRCALRLLDHQEREQEPHLRLLREQLDIGASTIDPGDTRVFDKGEVERLKSACRGFRKNDAPNAVSPVSQEP
jgi:putative addiction module CopG family antidote